jgi:hypothetical protein
MPIPWQDLNMRAIEAFHPMMLPIVVSFALFGGTIGFLIGILIDRKNRLVSAEHENEKKKIALDTLKEVMVTLAHHLLNAKREVLQATSSRSSSAPTTTPLW